MFETATREKYRFPFKGQISVEDLWDLSVNDLDAIFKTLNKEAKQTAEESLLATKSKGDTVLSTKIAIVKHIVSVKLAEVENKKLAHERAEQKQKIMAILASKQDQALQNKTPEELQAMLEQLG